MNFIKSTAYFYGSMIAIVSVGSLLLCIEADISSSENNLCPRQEVTNPQKKYILTDCLNSIEHHLEVTNVPSSAAVCVDAQFP